MHRSRSDVAGFLAGWWILAALHRLMPYSCFEVWNFPKCRGMLALGNALAALLL